MTFNSALSSFAFVLIIIWILRLVRDNKIMIKFALPWLFLSAFSLIFSTTSNVRNSIADFLGFEQASNAYFAVAIVALAFLGILLSIEITRASDRLERAASSIAISNVITGHQKTDKNLPSVKNRDIEP